MNGNYITKESNIYLLIANYLPMQHTERSECERVAF